MGNPGRQYERTRHNVGFDVIDALAGRFQIDVREKKHKALIGSGAIAGRRVMLAKPQTFMNASGESVAEILSYYGLDPEEDLLVVSDDINLPPGAIRIRKQGSAGGHNGLKSVIEQTGTKGFCRLRVGVGEKRGDDLVGHVLGRFSKEERALIDGAIEDAADAAEMIAAGGADRAMNEYNGKGRTP